MKQTKTPTLVYIAILSALATILMFFDFPIPFFPPFLKFDLSDAVIFASSVIVGPLGMIAIIVIRSILHWLLKGAEMGIPVGQLASILSSLSFTLTVYYFPRATQVIKSEKGQLIFGLVEGSIVMASVMFLANYFWITPFYFALGNMPLPDNLFNYVLAYVPFNLIKGALNGTMIFLLLPYVKKLKK